MYRSFVFREAELAIGRQKDQMVAALHSNSAFWESDEGQTELRTRIEELEFQANEALENMSDDTPSIEDLQATNPFFAAGARGQERLKADYQANQSQAQGLGIG